MTVKKSELANADRHSGGRDAARLGRARRRPRAHRSVRGLTRYPHRWARQPRPEFRPALAELLHGILVGAVPSKYVLYLGHEYSAIFRPSASPSTLSAWM
jgi:hypothetical protein